MAKNKHNAKVGSTVDRSDDRIKSTGEVFTPMELVYEMLSGIPTEVLGDDTKTYMDNSCGSGNFLFGLLQVLTGEVTLDGHPTYTHDKQQHRARISRMKHSGLMIIQQRVLIASVSLLVNKSL